MGTQPGNTSWIVSGAASTYESSYEQLRAARDVSEQNRIANFSPTSAAALSAANAAVCKTTISIEFVAKPNESHRVHALVPAAIISTLEGIVGFVGCAVMASHQEERLVTVLTFWQGDLSPRAAKVNSGWVCKLIDRYVDRRLRVQTMRTHLAIGSPRQVDSARALPRDDDRVPVV